jgi:hypothetical protein
VFLGGLPRSGSRVLPIGPPAFAVFVSEKGKTIRRDIT